MAKYDLLRDYLMQRRLRCLSCPSVRSRMSLVCRSREAPNDYNGGLIRSARRRMFSVRHGGRPIMTRSSSPESVASDSVE